MSNEALENLLHEDRTFPPDPAFVASANATPALAEQAAADRIAFWEDQARRLDWAEPWHTALDWSNAPFAQWFVGGRLNVAENCVDRHVAAGLGDRVAIHFEGEPGDTRTLTYAELADEVARAANALTELGVSDGDRVAIYLPMIPEAVISMLACARIGAVHSVVFGGFSAEALRSRIDDAQAVLVITSDGGYRRGAASPLKPAVDEAVEQTPSIRNVLVVRRTGGDVEWVEGRDHWWHDLVERQATTHEAQPFDAEHPLFILYTSGTTGKPKGILHTTGGYLTQAAYTHHNVFDLKADTDVYWCTADVGWVTGHSYIVYGPLANGATQVIYEGTPDTPHRGRWWEIVAKYGVTILYTAPTAIRTFMKWGEQIPAGHDLSSLRLLGSVGEPINPEAWMWYRRVIGGETHAHRGHLVADRDGRHHDQPAARRHHLQAGVGDGSAARDRRGGRRRRGPSGRSRRRRVPGSHGALARDAARDLGRQPAVRGHLLVALAAVLLRRRRGQARRGRRDLAAGSRG